MLHGRTKRGTPLRSTVGMRTIPLENTWFLVADRTHFRLFELIKAELGPFIELRTELVNPDGKKKKNELAKDRPGRSFDRYSLTHHGQKGVPRHSYGNSDPEERITQEFIDRIADMLENQSFNQDAARLIVLAEPRFLGRLRPALERTLPQAKIRFEERDFAWIETPQLEERLKEFTW